MNILISIFFIIILIFSISFNIYYYNIEYINKLDNKLVNRFKINNQNSNLNPKEVSMNDASTITESNENTNGIGLNIKMSEPINELGVFATRDFKKGELIEKSPTIYLDLLNYDDKYEEYLKNTKLYHYWFNTGICEKRNKKEDDIDSDDKCDRLIGLGFVSMINHSKENFNINYNIIKEDNRRYIMVYANKDISKDEELFDNYGDENWFKVRNLNEINI